jgi:formylglycine-generating enzyme required for sulfatase activity
MKKFSSFLVVLMLMLVSFTAGMEYPRGDVDHDGEVNISDVTCLIDYLLKGTWPDEVPDEPQTETFTVNGVSFTMVTVEGGTFTMGATAEQGDDAYYWEKPAHEVSLSSYSIGQTEVTQELWLAVMGSNPSYFSSNNGYTDNLQRPMELVSWDDCQTFITQLNALTGKTFRLPTEAEWEFAARGGNQSQGYKFAGSNTIDDVAWYNENSYADGTHTVATKAPNELGLYDMTGNVWEWCQDWKGEYSSDAQINPVGPSTGTYRVFRGGSWYIFARDCRVSYRNGRTPASAVNYLGLRLAL